MLVWIVCLLLVQVSLSLSALPTWSTNPSIQCGSISLITSFTSTSLTYPYTFANPFTSTPRLCLGILDWQMQLGTSNTLNVFLLYSGFNPMGTNVNVNLGSSTNLTSLIICLLAIDSSSTLMSAATVGKQIFTTNVTTGTGLRSTSILITLGSGALNLSHQNAMLPFISGFQLSSNTSTYTAIRLTQQIYNSTTYQAKFTVDGDNFLTAGSFYRINYDRTVVQESQSTYLDAGFLLAQNSIPLRTVSFPYSSQQNFMAGLNAFNYSINQAFDFDFTTDTFILTSVNPYNVLNLSLWNYRLRSCDYPTTYFVESENLCYDVCPLGTFANSTYSFCSPCDYTCQACTGPGQGSCISCNGMATFRLLNGSYYCVCTTGYYDNGTSTCLPCSPPCQSCSSGTVCLGCNTVGNMVLSGTTCVCVNNTALAPDGKSCVLCNSVSIGCLNCSNTVCTLCNTALNFILSGSQCICQPGYVVDALNGICIAGCPHGYYNDSGTCKEICGDGILFVLPCDDGNTQSGDGCSSTCQIETNYTCVNGTSTTPSLCSYNQPFTMAIISAVKDPSSNSISFSISVGPALKVLDTFNFSQIISTNIPNSKTTFIYSKGQLLITTTYTETIQASNVTLQLSPPLIYNNTFAMKVSDTKFIVTPSNMNAYYYQDNVYDQAKVINIVFLICTGVALISCAVSVRKLIGLEMISMLQMNILSLGLVTGLQPAYGLWAQYGRVSSGYNDLGKLDQLFAQFTMPQGIQIIGYKTQYLNNINWMLILEIGVLVVGLLVLLTGKFLAGALNRVGLFILKNMVFTLIFFNVLNSAFSLGLNIHSLILYRLPQGQIASNFISVLVSLALNTTLLVFYYRQTDLFKDQLLLLKMNRASTVHPIVFCLVRFVMGFLMGIYPQPHCLIIVLALQLGYLLYVSLNKPYKHNYLFARSVLNEVVVSYHLACLLVFNYLVTDEYTSENPSSTALAWVDVLLTAGATFFGLACLIYNLHRENGDLFRVPLDQNNSTVEETRVKDMAHSSTQKNEGKIESMPTWQSRRNLHDVELLNID